MLLAPRTNSPMMRLQTNMSWFPSLSGTAYCSCAEYEALTAKYTPLPKTAAKEKMGID